MRSALPSAGQQWRPQREPRPRAEAAGEVGVEGTQAGRADKRPPGRNPSGG